MHSLSNNIKTGSYHDSKHLKPWVSAALVANAADPYLAEVAFGLGYDQGSDQVDDEDADCENRKRHRNLRCPRAGQRDERRHHSSEREADVPRQARAARTHRRRESLVQKDQHRRIAGVADKGDRQRIESDVRDVGRFSETEITHRQQHGGAHVHGT